MSATYQLFPPSHEVKPGNHSGLEWMPSWVKTIQQKGFHHQPSNLQNISFKTNHPTNHSSTNQPPQQQGASPASPHIHLHTLIPTTQVPFAGRVLHGPLDHLVTIWADFWDHARLQLRFLRFSTQVGFHRLRLNDVAYGVWDGGGGGC